MPRLDDCFQKFERFAAGADRNDYRHRWKKGHKSFGEVFPLRDTNCNDAAFRLKGRSGNERGESWRRTEEDCESGAEERAVVGGLLRRFERPPAE